MDNDSDTIIINKYSSRRLYNTNSSEYVTLDDLCRLINEGKNFKIIDKDSGKDITNQYLLQIISDLENKEGNVFPQDVFCLLYTSPSPRDGLLSRMPSSA